MPRQNPPLLNEILLKIKKINVRIQNICFRTPSFGQKMTRVNPANIVLEKTAN
ncbi:hypothetical protein DFO77_12255 [Marinilabilia salmonicolor]|uniref:Uncharacterized protein n=1 Tax=Marinilabilia salmonicolor TaxID=989 RepID=A0A368UQH0_9BACT|nr:hypothetical protein DFO77_12255 [Marinilabilia salmonicolor]